LAREIKDLEEAVTSKIFTVIDQAFRAKVAEQGCRKAMSWLRSDEQDEVDIEIERLSTEWMIDVCKVGADVLEDMRRGLY
jgi:hypothetical protein